MARKKICFVVAVPGTARSFLKDHIAALAHDYDVYLACNLKNKADIEGLAVKECHCFPIERKISLRNDIRALQDLTSYFRKMRFDAVHSVTPKAGLITCIAARLAGIKHRIHIFTGQVWATRKGMSRRMLKSMDRLIALLNTDILVDGKSQQEFLIKEGVVSASKSNVLGDGSICGVNTDRFSPSPSIRERCRVELVIPADKTVFVFMGRLNHDKGLYELLPAFDRIASARDDTFLLLFGHDEEDIESHFKDYKNLNSSNFLYYGATKEPQNMLQAGDIFVLPTYREGFGSSVIEAACLGLPTITSDAYGVLDASVVGETGLQCKVGDEESLHDAMLCMLEDKPMRLSMGEKGRKRVLEKFSGSVVVRHWIDFYKEMLTQ